MCFKMFYSDYKTERFGLIQVSKFFFLQRTTTLIVRCFSRRTCPTHNNFFPYPPKLLSNFHRI
jgi:hypothetical protein